MVAKKPRILIVGAGMAGLTAAHQLQQVSCADNPCFELIVLEASHRIGGRICTSKFEGDRVELGATWIHGIEGSPVYDIAQRIGALKGDLPWERQDGLPGTGLVKAEGGLIVDPAIVNPIVHMYKKLMSEVRDNGDPDKTRNTPRSLGAFLRDSFNTFLSHQDSVYEIERKILCNKRNECIQTENFENQLGTWASRLGWNLKSIQHGVFSMNEYTERILTACNSLFDLDLEAEKEYEEYPGEHITIGKGYVSVLNELASSLPSGTIQFGKRVEQFLWNRSQRLHSYPVAVKCKDGSVIEADHIIITVSLGVLKSGIHCDCGDRLPRGDEGRQVCRSVQELAARVPNEIHPSCELFEPPLPRWKQRAIACLGFGVVDKLFLYVDPQAGEELRTHLQFIYKKDTSKNGSVPWWMRRTFSLCPIYKESCVLLAWFAGEDALEMESLTDEEIIDGVVKTLIQFGYPQKDLLLQGAHGECSDSEESSDDGEMCRERVVDSGYKEEELRKMFRGVLRSSWANNPLFQGSYSYVATSSTGLDFETLAEPLPKCEKEKEKGPLQLLFAGEATDRHFYSTTHGAYRSGLREANRLLHHYGLSPIEPV